MSEHSFYFKLVYTCQTVNYDIDLNMSMTEFINYVKDKIRVDFNIDNNYDIEIVEAGQPDNINGHDAELAPALEATNYTILQTYENSYKNTAFYIRTVMRGRENLENNINNNVIYNNVNDNNNNNINDNTPRQQR
jgi:hypothetical protein